MASLRSIGALLAAAASLLVCAHVISSKSPREALTPEQWTSSYRCRLQAGQVKSTLLEQQVVPWYKRVWFGVMDECNREEFAWRHSYIDELLDGFNQLIRDKNSDERLANVIYTTRLDGSLDHSYFQFNSGDSEQDRADELRVAGRQVNDEQCARDLTEMDEQLEELEERLEGARYSAGAEDSAPPLDESQVRLARVLDSFGRYGSGSLDGQNRAMGSYSQCIRTRLLDESKSEIQMRYCWAKLSLERQLNTLLRQRQRLAHEQAETGFMSAVCLPQSCHTRNLASHNQLIQRLVNTQLVMPSSIYINQSLELESLFCLVDEDSPFGMPLSGKLCIAFIVIWIALCVLATHARKRQHEPKGNQEKSAKLATRKKTSRLESAIECLDLGDSWHDYAHAQHQIGSEERVDLEVLNPVKIGCCIFVVGSHAGQMLMSVVDKPLEMAAIIERDSISQAALMASTVIDTFFSLSGMLLTYIMLCKLSTTRLKNLSFAFNWFILASARYLRLVPLYVLMWWFRRDVLIYLGWGPFWDFGFNRNTNNGACRSDSWITPFSFNDAFKPMQKSCFLPAWSVSNDIFYGSLLPPFILMLARWPRLGKYAMCTLIGASLMAAIYHYSTLTTPELRWEFGEFRLYGVFGFFGGLYQVYTWPIYRLPSFFVGALAGHALFKYNTRKLTAWPAWLTQWATQMAAGYLIGHTIISMYPVAIKEHFPPYHRLLSAHVATSDRMLWSVANVVLFLRMTTDWRSTAPMRAFAAPHLRAISRLNYCALFVHWILLIIQVGTMTTLPTFNYWHAWAAFASIYLLTMPISALVHVLFENPVDKLIKRQIFNL